MKHVNTIFLIAVILFLILFFVVFQVRDAKENMTTGGVVEIPANVRNIKTSEDVEVVLTVPSSGAFSGANSGIPVNIRNIKTSEETAAIITVSMNPGLLGQFMNPMNKSVGIPANIRNSKNSEETEVILTIEVNAEMRGKLMSLM
ncbi:MAG: hypothetical protein EBZ77_16195 [Chitinophagia bacterium]|nr:hypothetical protein [Chitinophagia bacterium]